MGEEKNNLIKYQLRAIETAKFNLAIPQIKLEEGQIAEINYHINPAVKYIVKDDLILITISVRGYVKQTDQTLLDAENVFVYYAINLKDHLELSEKEKTYKFKNVVDEGLIITLIGLSVSTMRGIIFEKSKGTILQFSPMPIINPSTFIKKKD